MQKREPAGEIPSGARDLRTKSGGGRGIRTPGTLSGTSVFKTDCFNRSHIPPRLRRVYQELKETENPGGERSHSRVSLNGLLKKSRFPLQPLKGRLRMDNLRHRYSDALIQSRDFHPLLNRRLRNHHRKIGAERLRVLLQHIQEHDAVSKLGMASDYASRQLDSNSVEPEGSSN